MTKRGAFSLVELIISIFLLGIIVVFLYSTVGSLQKTNKIYEQNSKELNINEKIVDLLYEDIFQANELNITGNEYSMLNLKTSNSLFDMVNPYVSWFVSRDKNTLLRFESKLPFKTINSQNNNYFHISKVGEDCEVFKIYQSKKKDKILINIKFKDREQIVYEFAKPLDIKKIKKPKNSTKGGEKNPPHNLNRKNPHIKIEVR